MGRGGKGRIGLRMGRGGKTQSKGVRGRMAESEGGRFRAMRERRGERKRAVIVGKGVKGGKVSGWGVEVKRGGR